MNVARVRRSSEVVSITPSGLNTVKAGESFNLKLGFDIPTTTSPQAFIYEYYDDDYNTLTIQIPLNP